MIISSFIFKTILATLTQCVSSEQSQGMKAIQQTGHGGPSTLIIDLVHPRPEPKDKEILIEVFYTAVNRLDILQRKGSLPVPKEASPILGLEVAGRVHTLGPKCSSKWKEGDRVMALVNGGGYAEYTTVDEDHVMAIPNHMTFKEAASIPEVWLTAYQLLHLISHVKEGEYVLIHAGGSGVGTAAVQLTVAAKGKAIVTAGSQPKIDKALSLGAVAGFNYKEVNFAEKILEFTTGKGVNIILDCVGSTHWSQNLNALAVDGRWTLYGLLGGPNVEGNFLGGLLKKRVTLSATTLRTRSDKYKAHLVQEFITNALPLFEPNSSPLLKVVIDNVFSLNEMEKAHQYLEDNKNIGKIVIIVQTDECEKQIKTDTEKNLLHGEESLGDSNAEL